MFQGDATALSKGGWTFKLEEKERVRALAIAAVLENQLQAVPELEEQEDGAFCLMDQQDRRDRSAEAIETC